MKKLHGVLIIAWVGTLFLFSSPAFAQNGCTATPFDACSPHIGLQLPAFGAFVNTWNVPVNANMNLIDRLLSGNVNLTALSFSNGQISGNVTFGGAVSFGSTINATQGGTFSGAFTGSPTFTNAGVFTNTQMNQYMTSSVNGLNFLAEAQFQNSGNFMTEAISAGLAVPLGATVWQANALAGYVTNASVNPTLGAAVAVFGHARSLGVNSRVWGGNFTVSSTLGTSSTNLNGIETDLNILNAGDGGIAYEATGGWLQQGTNVNGFYITKPQGVGNFFWQTAFGTAIGATNTPTSTSAAVFLQQVATGNSQNSQGLTFLSTNSGGTPIAGLFYQLPTGDLQFSSSAAAAALSTPNLKVATGVVADGGGFKHKRFGATTATAAGANAVASTTYSWTTGFADTSYTPICSPEGTVTGTPVYQGIISFNTSGVTVQVMAATAAASSFGGIYCHAVHD